MVGQVDRTVGVERARSAASWQTIIVGEAPSATSDPLQPLLGGRSGRFLAELLGVEPYQFGFLFRCVNLLLALPSCARKWRMMRSAGAHLRPVLHGRRTVALGRLVGAALELHDVPFFEWRSIGGIDAVVLPHPSGENRLWNNALRKRTADVLREEARAAAAGAREAMGGRGLPWLDRFLESS